jgi:hypothetical protein
MLAAGGQGGGIVWRWTRGDAVTPADVGDPVGGSTEYALCLYDETADAPSLALSLSVPPGGTCNGADCWKSTPRKVVYRDRDASRSGVRGLLIKLGAAGKSKAKLKARGSLFPVVAMPFAQQNELVAQLVSSDGACWESRYEEPASRNDDAKFIDRGDGP